MPYTSEELIYAAEKLRPVLSRDMREQLDPLLERARAGERIDIQIVDLLSEDEEASRWMRQALFSGQGETIYRGLEKLGGDPGAIKAGSIWVCSTDGCDFEWRVLRAGHPVPPCPNHGLRLVPAK